MTKTKIAIILLSGACALTSATAVAGWCIATGGGSSGKIPPSVSGVSTTIHTNEAPNKLTPENAIYAFLQKQCDLKSYEILTEGMAVANLFGYKQEINNITFKNGDDFLNQASSDSTLVKMEHQSFSKEGKVVYRNNFKGEMSVATKDEYKKVYGFTADEVTLGGYIINPKTLRYAALEETEGDALTYHMRLTGDLSVNNGTATESATASIRLQAQAYGSLDDVPAFSDVDMYLTVKKDWTPVSYISSCSYECKKGVKMSITQTLACTYSKVNEPVTIPDVAEFNEKIGSEPSAVQPGAASQDPLTNLASAFGNTMGEDGSLSMPVSISLALSDSPLTLGGHLELKLKEDALESGGLLDAFKLRLDLDLSSIPLISGIANTITVRYPGDGQLLLMLNNRSQGADKILLTYPVDLGKSLSSLTAGLSSGDLGQILTEYVEIEASQTGYAISLKSGLLDTLNTYIKDFVKKAEETLNDKGGYVSSLLGIKFTGLTVNLEGKDKITKLALVLEGEPPVNVTQGEKIGVNLKVGLLETAPMFTLKDPFTGTLQLRLNPAALLTGDFYAIADAHLELDLSAAQQLLALVALAGGSGSLPAWVGPGLKGLDVYYTGDGMLTLSLKNAETEDNLLFATQINLKNVQLPSLSDGTLSSLLSAFRLERTEKGIVFALGEPLVAKLDAAYQQLVEKVKAYISSSMGDLGGLGLDIGGMIGPILGADISGVELFLGKNDQGKTMFDFTIKGTSAQITSEGSLLSLTLTHEGGLKDDEKTSLANGKKTASDLYGQYLENVKTAENYTNKIQALAEDMDLTASGRDAYAAKVEELKKEVDELPANVQMFISNISYLADTNYNGAKHPMLWVKHKLYCDRVDAFTTCLPSGDNYESFDKWEELNALYDKQETTAGIDVPAVKDCPEMQDVIGNAHIEKYLEARSTHEIATANALKTQIEGLKAQYQDATGREQLTAALTQIVTEIKPAYDKLPQEKQDIVKEAYWEYVKMIYLKNIKGVTEAYQAVQTKLKGLAEKGESASIDELLTEMKNLAEAYAWESAKEYWTAPMGSNTPWGNWVTALKPSDLTAEEAQKVTALNTLQQDLIGGKGDTAKAIAEKLKGVIEKALGELKTKIEACEKEEEWDFSQLGDTDAQKAVLEELHGLRFMILKVLPIGTTWNEQVAEFKTKLATYESKLADALAPKE